MTQPNQSELEDDIRNCFTDTEMGLVGELELFDTEETISNLMNYITANYTPNSEVADKVNTAVVTRELELDHQWSKELERKLKEVK